MAALTAVQLAVKMVGVKVLLTVVMLAEYLVGSMAVRMAASMDMISAVSTVVRKACFWVAEKAEM